MSVCLQTKCLWVWVPLQSLKFLEEFCIYIPSCLPQQGTTIIWYLNLNFFWHFVRKSFCNTCWRCKEFFKMKPATFRCFLYLTENWCPWKVFTNSNSSVSLARSGMSAPIISITINPFGCILFWILWSVLVRWVFK